MVVVVVVPLPPLLTPAHDNIDKFRKIETRSTRRPRILPLLRRPAATGTIRIPGNNTAVTSQIAG